MEYRITIRNAEGVTVFEWPAIVYAFGEKLDQLEDFASPGWSVTFTRAELVGSGEVSEPYYWDGSRWLVPDEREGTR